MKNKPCHCCDGSGVEANDVAIGSHLRDLRQKAGIQQKDMAKVLGVSPSMLVFLETGRRRWSAEMIYKYEQAALVANGKVVDRTGPG